MPRRLFSADSHCVILSDQVKRNLAAKFHADWDAGMAKFDARRDAAPERPEAGARGLRGPRGRAAPGLLRPESAARGDGRRRRGVRSHVLRVRLHLEGLSGGRELEGVRHRLQRHAPSVRVGEPEADPDHVPASADRSRLRGERDPAARGARRALDPDPELPERARHARLPRRALRAALERLRGDGRRGREPPDAEGIAVGRVPPRPDAAEGHLHGACPASPSPRRSPGTSSPASSSATRGCASCSSSPACSGCPGFIRYLDCACTITTTFPA